MQKEAITASGAIIRYEQDTVHQDRLKQAVDALGGLTVVIDVDPHRETVLQIMDQNVIGTTLMDSDGIVYTLTSNGWVYPDGTTIKLPPYEQVTSASMPGGWSWTL